MSDVYMHALAELQRARGAVLDELSKLDQAIAVLSDVAGKTDGGADPPDPTSPAREPGATSPQPATRAGRKSRGQVTTKVCTSCGTRAQVPNRTLKCPGCGQKAMEKVS